MRDPTYKRCKCRGEDGRELGAHCPRLRRADGSWNPRHGDWYFAMELPPGLDGKRRPRLRRGGFTTQADALAGWEAARGKLRKGADPASRLTAGRVLREWLAGRPDLKASTRRSYALHIAAMERLVGHIDLDRLRAADITSMFAAIAASPTHPGPATMQRIRATLRAALNDAVRDGLIPFNPASRLRMAPERRPRPLVWTLERTAAFWAEHARRMAENPSADPFKVWRDASLRPGPVMVWIPEQTGAFLDHAAGNRLAAMFETIAATGMRRSEACGLGRADTDLDGGVITVSATRVQIGWDVQEETPKSEAGQRDIALDQRTVAVLRAHLARQAADRLAWGEAWAGTGLVFTHEDGSPLHPATVSNRFRRLAFEAGLPPVSLHSLRHGAATYALAAGVDVKVVQQRLGHSTSALTRDTYTSVLPDVAHAAAEAAAALIPRAVSGTGGLPTDSQATTTGSRRKVVRENMQVSAPEKGGAPGARTLNPRIKSPLLCH
jgi:integrase